MGTLVRVDEQQGAWRRCGTPDGYAGWVPASDLGPAPEEFRRGRQGVVWSRFAHPRALPVSTQAPLCCLSLGTRLPILDERDGWSSLRLADGRAAWVRSGALRPAEDPPRDPLPQALLAKAEELLGTPYLWGGGSALGIDCSGFVQLLYGLFGCLLPRDAHLQCREGEPVDRGGLREGDLVFYTGAAGGSAVAHVGLYRRDGRIIHASGSGQVMVSEVDDPVCGRYWGARRYLRAPSAAEAAGAAGAPAVG